VVNERMKILQFRGQVGRYLEPASGEATFNLSKMACPALSLELRAAILKAKKAGGPVRREGLKLDRDGRLLEVNVEVIPLDPAEAEEGRFLVLFDEAPAVPLAEKNPADTKSAAAGKEANPAEPTEVASEAERLRYELASTKETLQMIVEEHESVNEEFRAANEEIQSSNEELQSTNEELETAKEELQSTNEELTTVNDELENRNIQLSQAMSDLHNLLNSVNVPVVMLDPDLRIRSFTPLAQQVLKLIPADAGRPIGELKLGIQVASLEAQIMDVIENLNTKEQDVQTADGCWYSMRIRPVRTADQRVVGAVLTLLDITAHRVALQDAQVLAEQIVATIREPLLILDAHLRVVSANAAFYKAFQVAAADTENRSLYDLGSRQWDIPGLRTLLEEIIPRHSHFENFPVDQDFRGIGRKKMLLNARQIERANGETRLILLAIEEVADDQDTGG
jgi:two-component system CheB/CheR fusion protein